MKALCDKLVGIINKLAEEDVKEVTKGEEDHSWSTFITESCEFKTVDGKTIRITITTPKKSESA